ncbi:MAG: porphobilinogen synthase [Holophagales bacterium]|nr:porphobilinogen synthase [Holophagales bacterium]
MTEREFHSYEMPIRPRRNRRTAAIRALARETELSPSCLIQPLFLIEGSGVREPIASMPGIDRFSVDLLVEEARACHHAGVPAVALFPALDDALKDRTATESTNPDGLLQRAVRALKDEIPELLVITDVAMDPYSADGHDGYVEGGEILNDPTLDILAEMAVSQARAGADLVAPSDMMDGRVAVIREALDEQGFENVGILAYTAKYASSFYGPFREALDSAPRGGDKKTYQMDPANAREALREAALDVAEGADIVMVKPALPYLDVVRRVREAVDVPVAAYQVSGEYAMIQAVAEKGWMDADALMLETLLSIRRAGADMVLSYFARRAAERLG